jgi:hypothetical protein
MIDVKHMLGVHGFTYVAHIFRIIETCASIFMMDYVCDECYKKAASCV